MSNLDYMPGRRTLDDVNIGSQEESINAKWQCGPVAP